MARRRCCAAVICHVAVVGSYFLNQEDDIDSLWTTEIAVPVSIFGDLVPRLPPADADVWRVNLYRTGGAAHLQYITWSNTRAERPWFRAPERLGVVRFSKDDVCAGAGPAASTAVEPQAP